MKTLLIFLFSVLFFAIPVVAEQEIVVSMPQLTEDMKRMPEFERVISEAYTRAGLSATFKYVPMMRDYIATADNDTDASAGRTALALGNNSRLIGLSVPLVKTKILAFSGVDNLKIDSWTDLASYRVGYQRGDMTSTLKLGQAGVEARVLGDMRKGFELLHAGRLDVFVTHLTFVYVAGLGDNLDGVHVAGELYSGHFYHCVNQENIKLVPALEQSFREMLKDGTTQELLGKYHRFVPTTGATKSGLLPE